MKIKKEKILEVIFGIMIILNVSGVFRFLFAQLGISIGIYTFLSLLLNLVYMLVNINLFKIILKKKQFWNWFIILLIWPLITTLYTTYHGLTDIIRLFFFFSLFASSVLFFVKNDIRVIKRIFGIGLLITVLGGVLSVLLPEIFQSTILAVNGNPYLSDLGRAFGFEIQANRLACNTSFMFIVWFSVQNWNNNSLKIILSALVLITFILITGSRTGLVISFVIIFLIILNSLRYKKEFVKRIGNYLILGIVGIVLFISAAGFIAKRNPDTALADRMNSIYELFSRDYNVSSKDGDLNSTLSVRSELQLAYFNMIVSRPWGYGFKGDLKYIEEGTLKMTAHSEMLTTAFQFGVLYPIVTILLFMNFLNKKKRRKIEEKLGTTVYLQFFIVFLLLFSYAQGTLISRAFLVTFASLYAMFYFPNSFLKIQDNE